MTHLLFLYDPAVSGAEPVVRSTHYYLASVKSEALSAEGTYKITSLAANTNQVDKLAVAPADNYAIYAHADAFRCITKELFLTLTALINKLQTNEVKVPDITVIA